MYQKEAFGLLLVGAMLIMWYVGSSINAKKVKSWVATHKSIWDKQFRAMSPLTPKPPLTDGPSTHLLYFTGRRNLLSLHIIFNLKPRHNLLAYLYNFGYSLVEPAHEQEIGVEDQVVLDFTLGEGNLGLSGEGPGVWAMVDRSGVLPVFRKERWDVTFAKAVESPIIPQSHMVLQETADSTDYILKTPNVGLAEVMAHPEVAQYVKSLLITDQPPNQPTRGPLPPKHQSRHVILTLRMPSPSNAHLHAPIIEAVFNIIDLLGKVPVKPETTKKLRKIRQDVDAELAKEFEKRQKEDSGETEEDKKVAKRKAEEARRKMLSPEEQRKLEEKDRKKALRKSQTKMTKRG